MEQQATKHRPPVEQFLTHLQSCVARVARYVCFHVLNVVRVVDVTALHLGAEATMRLRSIVR